MIEGGGSPNGVEEDRLSFSLSDDEVDETTDSLDIKPPQAASLERKSRSRREKGQRSSKHDHRRGAHSASSRSDDRRKEHKSDRTQGQRDRDYQQYQSKESQRHTDHHRRGRDRGEGREHGRSKRDPASQKEERNASEKRSRDPSANYDAHMRGEEQLDDLRGKLLEKRSQREGRHGSEPERKRQKKEKRSEKLREVEPPAPVIPAETEEERDERLRKEERRSKLLEAEREMALRKEVSRRELEARRERHNLEKEKNRMLKEIAKKHRQDGEKSEEDDDADGSESDDSDDSSSTTSSDDSSDDTTDEEEKVKTPESAPPLEKSPLRTPQAAESLSSRGGTPEMDLEDSHINKNGSEERELEPHEAYEEKSPEIILKEDTLPPYLPALQGCRSVEEFQCLNRIEEGTYGVVYRARDKRTLDIVALKRLKMEKEKEGFPITSLREINTLLKAQHPNIVTVREIVVGSNMDKIFIVMEYVEHDLKSLMETMKSKKQVFLPGEIKCLMIQLLRAVAHLHDNWILHRDLKTSNLLLSHKGVLKVGDFGLAREYGSPKKNYTPIVVTLWYRAPELLLQAKEYTTAIDVWSVGCIFGELLQMSAVFNGTSEMNQLNKIFKELGTPNEKSWPGCSKLPAFQKVTFADFPVNQIKTRFGNMLTDLGLNLMNAFLTYDPERRITAEEALKHGYFREVPLPIDPAMFPTWPAKSENGAKKVNNSPKPPSGGKAYKQLGDEDDEMPSGGFHMGAAERRINVPGPGFSLRF